MLYERNALILRSSGAVSMRKHFQDFYRLLSETMVMSKISDRQREAIKLTQQMLQERPLTPDTSSNVLLTVQAQHVGLLLCRAEPTA